jgi:hypothetical protein
MDAARTARVEAGVSPAGTECGVPGGPMPGSSADAPKVFASRSGNPTPTNYSRIPFFNSQTFNAARSRLLVRESVPTAGRVTSPSTFGPLFRRRLGVFARFLGRGRMAASLFERCPLGCNGVIITIKSSFPASLAEAPFFPRKALVPPHFFGDFIRAWQRIENWVV